MALIAEEEARAQAWRDSVARRAAASAQREAGLRGNSSSRAALRDDWSPLALAIQESRERWDEPEDDCRRVVVNG